MPEGITNKQTAATFTDAFVNEFEKMSEYFKKELSNFTGVDKVLKLSFLMFQSGYDYAISNFSKSSE